MARPEQPVEGTGPVADLARELRRIRNRAGNPGYRELAAKAMYSRETLSAAARGEQCPTWDVTKAFADACDPTGTEARRLRDLWEKAGKARHRRQARARCPAASRNAARPAAAAGRAPRPDPGGSPADFVYQMRLLRAWAGSPGRIETRQRLSATLPSSTMYDALSPRRTILPPLHTVQLIIRACLDDEDEIGIWVSAWRSISVQEFISANPRPSGQPEGGITPLRIISGGSPQSRPGAKPGDRAQSEGA